MFGSYENQSHRRRHPCNLHSLNDALCVKDECVAMLASCPRLETTAKDNVTFTTLLRHFGEADLISSSSSFGNNASSPARENATPDWAGLMDAEDSIVTLASSYLSQSVSVELKAGRLQSRRFLFRIFMFF